MNKSLTPFQRTVRAAVSRYQLLSGRIDAAVGISEVHEAQESVQLAEDKFLAKRNDVHALKVKLESIREKLREIRSKLDRCSREDERYLVYVTEEHNFVKEERSMKGLLEIEEEGERDRFVLFSTAVRVSHEKERARTERTKYWSLIGSVIGTLTGFALSSILTHYRFKKIQELTPNAELKESTDEIKQQLENHSKLLQQFATSEKPATKTDGLPTKSQMDALVKMIKSLESSHEMRTKELGERISETMHSASINAWEVAAKRQNNNASLTVADYENWTPTEDLAMDSMPLQMYNALLSRISLGLSLFSQGLLVYLVITGR